ncbi:MAG: hypothetical protein ACK4GT_21375, partial [Pararhodobacter sp.]
MIAVGPSDLPGLAAALDRVALGPIFLQSNLGRYGLASGAPRSVHLWRNEGWTAFLGLTVAGILMPQMAQADAADWACLPRMLVGHDVSGMNGQAEQVADCLAWLDLPHPRLDRIEPCLSLPLCDLRMPPQEGLSLRPVRPDDMALVTG